MLPAFGSPEAKALLPIFSNHAGQVRILCHNLRGVYLTHLYCTGNVNLEGYAEHGGERKLCC